LLNDHDERPARISEDCQLTDWSGMNIGNHLQTLPFSGTLPPFWYVICSVSPPFSPVAGNDQDPPEPFNMTITNMVEFFVHELRESFNAEKQLVEALPNMIVAAKSPFLREFLESRLRVSEDRVERLTEVFISIGEYARGRTSAAVDAFIRTGNELIETEVSEEADHEVPDSALIAITQKVTHHGIAVYGTLATWARMLDFKVAFRLLEMTLEEDRAAAEHLAELARLEFEMPLSK
jgi:ferritin-like metal-binding protein YciE